MPGLKKLISKAEVGASRAWNGKLHKRSSQLAEGVVNFDQNNWPLHQPPEKAVETNKRSSMKAEARSAGAVKQIVPEFEPEDPPEDPFDQELQASKSRPRNKYIAGPSTQQAEEIRPVSRYGLVINTDTAVSPLRPSPSNGLGDDAQLHLRSDRRSASSSWYTVNSQGSSVNNAYFPDKNQGIPITPQSSIGDEASGFIPANELKKQGKKPLLNIRDLDWGSVAEDEALNIAKAYGFGRRARKEENSETNESTVLGGKKQTIVQRWLNDQDFSEELNGYLAIEEEERQRAELERAIQRCEEEERARKLEIDRLHAEEKARLEAEAEAARIAVEAAAEEARVAAELAAELARRRECMVCGDLKAPLEYAAKPPTAACEHPSQTCQECLEAWMASEFETKGCDGIKCPECPMTLEYADVQAAASEETFAAYDKLAMRNALGGFEEFSWCLKPECGSGQLNIDNNAFMHCVSCGYKQCLTHKVEWHFGETCEAYEYRVSGQKQKDEEKKTEAMLDTMSKKCPNAWCGWRIEKISGCDHMRCKRCKYEFCWLCLASHAAIKAEGNTAHQKDCKYHSDNLEVAWPFNRH